MEYFVGRFHENRISNSAVADTAAPISFNVSRDAAFALEFPFRTFSACMAAEIMPDITAASSSCEAVPCVSMFFYACPVFSFGLHYRQCNHHKKCNESVHVSLKA